jgi:hypothetical protein
MLLEGTVKCYNLGVDQGEPDASLSLDSLSLSQWPFDCALDADHALTLALTGMWPRRLLALCRQGHQERQTMRFLRGQRKGEGAYRAQAGRNGLCCCRECRVGQGKPLRRP